MLEHRQATWLELFFDLVFVAVIGILTHKMAHLHHGHLDFKTLAEIPLLFAPIWWIWSSYSLYMNRFESDDRKHRLVFLVVMGLVISLSTTLTAWDQKGFMYFVILYGTTRFILGLLYASNPQGKRYNRSLSRSIFAGACISFMAVFFPTPLSYGVFLCGMILDVSMHIRLSGSEHANRIHRKHLAERVGLLTIILLGESIISIVSSFGDMAWTLPTLFAGGLGFLILCLIWWIFFDSFHVFDHAKKFKSENFLIYPNFFFCLGLISLATLIRHSISGEMSISDFQILATVGMTLFYVGKQIPYMYLVPAMRKGIVLNSITCISITFMSGFLPKVEYAIGTIALAMLFYVYSNMKWVLPKDWSTFQDEAW